MTEGNDPLVDRDALAHSPGESPRALPHPGDLFPTLQRVIDATRAVFQVDGASLALAHEDGSLRWVVVTDGAAGLLEDTHSGSWGRDRVWPPMVTRWPWWSSTWPPTGASPGWPRW
jgi:hypothetical protein